jgi:hypothetical protein
MKILEYVYWGNLTEDCGMPGHLAVIPKRDKEIKISFEKDHDCIRNADNQCFYRTLQVEHEGRKIRKNCPANSTC